MAITWADDGADAAVDVHVGAERTAGTAALPGPSTAGQAAAVYTLHPADRPPAGPMRARAEPSVATGLAERLHDGPLQEVIALQLRLGRELGVHEVRSALEGVVAALRDVIAQAQPVSTVSLADRLVALTATCPWADVRLEYRLAEEPSEQVRDLVARCVAESVGNLRHAGAATATVSVVEQRRDGEEPVVRVTVHDDGIGCDPAAALRPRRGHLGLAWLAITLEAVGGRLRLLSGPGRGTRVAAEIPFGARRIAPTTADLRTVVPAARAAATRA